MESAPIWPVLRDSRFTEIARQQLLFLFLLNIAYFSELSIISFFQYNCCSVSMKCSLLIIIIYYRCNWLESLWNNFFEMINRCWKLAYFGMNIISKDSIGFILPVLFAPYIYWLDESLIISTARGIQCGK